MKPHIVSVTQAGGYALPVYRVERAPDLDLPAVRRVPVVVAGGGLSGLAFAVDLASRGYRCIVLDEDDTVGVRGAASRGIAYARKTLEILSRLGAADPVLAKGVTWSVGRTLDGSTELFRFDLAAGASASLPPFVNIQQFYVEAALVDRAYELGVELRWKNEVRSLRVEPDHVRLGVDTPEGSYELEASWLVDATGVNSRLRQPAGVAVDVEKGVDRWCICDVRFETQWPCERWTWTRAPFNEGRAVWQHPLPDDVWRLDYQLADGEEGDVDQARARAMVTAHVGPDARFEVVWAGPWTYRNQLARTFRRGPVFVIGDAAHAFSPFGGRGGNSGVQDAENLAWKLALVLAGRAPEALLDTYDTERRAAARLNIEITTATIRFLKPLDPARRLLRNAVLGLARRFPAMRRFVNTGKLSVAFTYPTAPGLTHGGQSLPDLPLRTGQEEVSLLTKLTAGPIAGLVLDFCENAASASALRERLALSCSAVRYRRVVVSPQDDELQDSAALRAEAAMPPRGDAVLLVRPDGHVCALAMGADRLQVEAAIHAMLRSDTASERESLLAHRY